MNNVEDNRDKQSDRHVFNHEVEDETTGVAAIIKAFIRNPGGAVQIIAFFGGMYGVYYAIEGEIHDVKAENQHRYEQLVMKQDAVVDAVKDSQAKIDAIYARSDSRYTGIIAKLSAHDVDIAEIKTGVAFIVKQFEVHNPQVR